MSSKTRVALAAGVALLLAIPGIPLLLGIRKVPAGAEPLEVTDGFPYDVWESVLTRFVGRDGQVAYTDLAGDSEDLRRFVATLAVAGPKTRPELFTEPGASFAWHINAYNAATLLGIIDSWPNAGVHDIHGPLNPKDGFGFFWALRFELDGRWTNTFDFENEAMRPVFNDARLHAAINCASASCPRLSRNAYRPEVLDEQLDRAAAEFVSTPPHVVFDADAKVVRLSEIFQWFPTDFEAHAATFEKATVLDWIERYSYPSRRVLANQARVEGWAIEYAAYDWSLNGR